MHARSIDPARELEGLIGDLSSILALQSAWNGQPCELVGRALGAELLRVLDLGFVFVRWHSPRRDFITLDPRYGLREEDITVTLQPWLLPGSDATPSSRLSLAGSKALSITSLDFGAKGLGTLIAGAAREGFPSRLDSLLLQATASQACVAILQSANLNVTQSIALTQLHRFSTGLIEAGDLSAVLEQMLTATIELQRADFGNVQLFDPNLDGLVIVAQRNFQRPFLEHFALVRADESACGRAAEARCRIVIEDIETEALSPIYRKVAREAGYRAVQSTPLFSHGGELLGMLSTHFRKAHRPSEHELRLTDVYVQQAARMIERKRTEDERTKLAAIVQNCSDLIGIAALDGRAVFVNSAGRAMIGLGDNAPLPTEVRDYVADADRERFINQVLPEVERDGFWEGEVSFRHFAGGPVFPVLQHIFYIRDAQTGSRLALATICRDITERKRSEDALVEAQRVLAHAGRVLSIGELTASLAHEVNQPLAAIVVNANATRRWLEREVPNYKRARESLNNIVRDGNRASEIIQRVRAFSSKAEPSRTRLNLNEVISEVVAIAAHEIAREQVVLRTHLAADLPTVMADRLELEQVVLNLVINGLEALRPVAGRLKDLTITSSRRNKGTIEVAVQDNGSGIDVQHIGRMFEAFFTTKSRGMGLGLAISRRIIEAHNGTLRVTVNPEWGLTFAFTLPVPRRR